MTTYSFNTNDDLKRAIEDQLIQPSRFKAFLKSRGVAFLCSNANDLAELSYTLFLGREDIKLLQEIIQTEKNYQKSTMLLINPKNFDNNSGTFSEVLIDELNKYRGNCGSYKLESVTRNENDKICLDLSYDKLVKGKISLVSQKKKTLHVEVEPIEGTEKYKVDVRQEDSADSKEFFKFIKQIQGEEENSLFEINHISLKSLLSANKISFFLGIASYNYLDWRIDDITGISVSSSENEDDEEELDSVTDTTGTVSGIKSAVLKGKSLNTNSVVKMFLDKSFICTAMKYKYRHKKESKSTIIDINFKDDDIKINIEKTFIKEDISDKETPSPLPSTEQDAIIKVFQEAAYTVYKKLLDEQAKLVKTNKSN